MVQWYSAHALQCSGARQAWARRVSVKPTGLAVMGPRLPLGILQCGREATVHWKTILLPRTPSIM